WKGIEKDNYGCRLNSLVDLLRTTLEDEEKQLEYMIRRDHKNWTALEAIAKHRLLSRRLLSGISNLLDQGLSSQHDSARETALKFRAIFSDIEVELTSMEED